jgi:hypothetical protein
MSIVLLRGKLKLPLQPSALDLLNWISRDFNPCKGTFVARNEVYRKEAPDNLHVGSRMKIEFLSGERASHWPSPN